VLRNRTFLFGLGLGLILGAALLQLMLSADRQQERLGGIDRLGGESAVYSQEDVDRMVDDAVKKAVEDAARQQPAAAPGDAAGKGAPAPNEAAASGKAGAASDAEETGAAGKYDDVDVRIVRIKKGATSEQVAKLLKDEGIIEDGPAFLKLMSDSSTRIRAGKFLFVGNPSPEKVKEIITGTPFAL